MKNLKIQGIVELEDNPTSDIVLPFFEEEAYENLFEVSGFDVRLIKNKSAVLGFQLALGLQLPYLLKELVLTVEDFSSDDFYMTFQLEYGGDELDIEQLHVILYRIMHIVMYHETDGKKKMQEQLMTGVHVEEGMVHWTTL